MVPVLINTQSTRSNVLNRDIKNIFLPSDLMQHLFLSTKFVIKNGILYPIGMMYNIIVVFFLITIFVCWCSRLINSFDSALNGISDTAMGILFYFYGISLIIFYIFNSLRINSYITLISKIHFIQDNLNFKGIKCFIVWSWMSNVITLFVNFALVFTFYTFIPHFNFLDVLIDVFYINFDVHFIYSLQFIILLRHYLNYWNDNLLKHIGEETDEYWMKLFEIYKSIMEAYDLYKKLFQILVSHHTFIVNLTVAMDLEGKNKKRKKTYTMLPIHWILNKLSSALYIFVCL